MERKNRLLNLSDGYFVDIKTTKDIHERKWNETYAERATFIENYGYVLQMAVYCELLRQQYKKDFVPIIAAVSKQTPSEARLITLSNDKMAFELFQLRETIGEVQKVKNGEKENLIVVGGVTIVVVTTKLPILLLWMTYREGAT